MVPDRVLNRVQYHINKINEANAEITRARGIDASGRYEWEYRITNCPDLTPSIAFFAEFEALAVQNGVDAEAVYAELGSVRHPCKM